MRKVPEKGFEKVLRKVRERYEKGARKVVFLGRGDFHVIVFWENKKYNKRSNIPKNGFLSYQVAPVMV